MQINSESISSEIDESEPQFEKNYGQEASRLRDRVMDLRAEHESRSDSISRFLI
jgi:hypothetical protein